MTVPRHVAPAPAAPRLPDFLVIGGMKCGTTTLYRDLLGQEGVFLPDKESNALLQEDPLAACARWFAAAAPGQAAGEVCPDYTKPGLGERAAASARDICQGREAPRLLFLAREPIARLLSHHRFISSQHGEANPGGMGPDIEASLRDFPELVDTSRYVSRLRPWLEAFGAEALQVIRLEDYAADRAGVLAEVAGWLGIDRLDEAAIDASRAHNASEARPVATPFWRRVMRHPLYRRCLRPLFSLEARDRLRSWLLPPAPPRPALPGPETLRRLAEELKPEVAALSALLGREEPLWDLDAAVAGLLAEAPAGQAATRDAA